MEETAGEEATEVETKVATEVETKEAMEARGVEATVETGVEDTEEKRVVGMVEPEALETVVMTGPSDLVVPVAMTRQFSWEAYLMSTKTQT